MRLILNCKGQKQNEKKIDCGGDMFYARFSY